MSIEEEPNYINDIVHPNNYVEVIQTEPTENEINMLKGTMNPSELIENEKTEEILMDKNKIYITKVKCIAMDMCGKSITSNPSYMSQGEKNKIMACMKMLLDSDDDIDKKFNDICIEKVFNNKADYDKIFNKLI